jgi:hypothetical protein
MVGNCRNWEMVHRNRKDDKLSSFAFPMLRSLNLLWRNLALELYSVGFGVLLMRNEVIRSKMITVNPVRHKNYLF